VKELTHIDLFSGIGGFALAARWAGIKTVQFVEIDPFCRKVLAKNFPGVNIHDDIKTFTNTECSRFNGQTIPIQSRESQQEGSLPTGCNQRPFLLTGGFPCQPFSCAGKRKGTGDDRHLWPEMLRVIKEFNPEWIIGENVGGIINIKNLVEPGSDFDMEDEADNGGEDSGSTSVLVSILSDLNQAGYSVQLFLIPACAVGAPHRRDRVWIVANSASDGCVRRGSSVKAKEGLQQRSESTGELERRSERPYCHAPDTQSEQAHTTEQRGLHAKPCGKDSDVTHTGNQGLQGSKWPGSHEQRQAAHGSIAERNNTWDEPWIEAATRLCRVDDGVSKRLDETGGISGKLKSKTAGARVHRLKALGNAIVPQVAYEIMKAILEADTTSSTTQEN